MNMIEHIILEESQTDHIQIVCILVTRKLRLARMWIFQMTRKGHFASALRHKQYDNRSFDDMVQHWTEESLFWDSKLSDIVELDALFFCRLPEFARYIKAAYGRKSFNSTVTGVEDCHGTV
jgi:hypothetical protein